MAQQGWRDQGRVARELGSECAEGWSHRALLENSPKPGRGWETNTLAFPFSYPSVATNAPHWLTPNQKPVGKGSWEM